jgi:hypothetical protein
VFLVVTNKMFFNLPRVQLDSRLGGSNSTRPSSSGTHLSVFGTPFVASKID